MEMKRMVHIIFLLAGMNTHALVGALHIIKVGVPTPLAVGEGGWLECEWADDGDSIYALKWYLGLDEFYRWTPAENPPIKTFAIKGDPLAVDRASSERGRVRIEDVKLGAAGLFRCEVSAEAPSFHTESQTGQLNVVDLPDEKPVIVGGQSSYQLEEEVILNCSSPRSSPAATLAFYINGEKADSSWLVHYPSVEEGPGTTPSKDVGVSVARGGRSYTGRRQRAPKKVRHLQTAVLGLRFPLWSRLVRRGSATVKCTASILNVYWDSSEVELQADLPYHASIMEGRQAHAGSAAMTTSGLTLLVSLLVALWH